MPLSPFFLGVDTGGSKTHALIASADGQIVGFGAAGPGNHEVVGYDGVRHALRQSVQQALTAAGLTTADLAGAGFGVAGYDWPSERAMTLDAISVLHLACPLEVVNDMVIGLIAGASQGWGVVIDAGTGSNCRGRAPDGREGFVTGCGHRFGEHGGGGDLVTQAVWDVTYEWCQRGPATRLTPALIAFTGARDLEDLVEGLTMERYHLSYTVARLVFEVAEAGDAVARDSIAWLANELAEMVKCVVRQLHFENLEFEVVQIGSLFKGGPLLTEPMQQAICAAAPYAHFVPLNAPPVVGGVLLAMQQAGRDFRPVRARLIEQAQTL